MKEHPILFSAPMVLALLDDRKHVTRRLSPIWMKVKAGDRLWVRETWNYRHELTEAEQSTRGEILRRFEAGEITDLVKEALALPTGTGERRAMYAADFGDWAHNPDSDLHWRSSMFMPRWASRILLECEEDARRERLRAITDEDAVLEGCPGELDFTPAMQFAKLWSTLHAKPGERWQDNPEVTRVGRFRRVA